VDWLRRFERLFWTAGILLLAAFGAAYIHRSVLSRRDLAHFRDLARSRETRASIKPRVLPGETPPDQSLWSKERVAAYAESRKQKAADPLAVLRIPKIGLEVAVLEGTDDFTLNRAVGHIEDTPRPGQKGNVGIAGHRDGFFRGLKDVVKGDTMELETVEGRETYRVDDIWIVQPEDVYVLDPTPAPAVTLVACYPFYFVGHAPQRYIVRAVRADAGGAATP
jgi:sortase A